MKLSRLLLCSFFLSPLFALASDPPEISTDGLELVDKSRSGHLYSDPNVDWSVYQRINLEKASVSFRRNWQRDQNRSTPHKVRNEDVLRIKSELAALFDEVFSKELSENGGYKIVTESGDDVMIIRPAITDLDVAAPDTQRAIRTTSYTESSGKMTLNLGIYDSVTGDHIAQARDRKQSPRTSWMQMSTSVSNRADAQRMLQSWATALRKRLDEARSGNSG
jgi:hypothetical protein